MQVIISELHSGTVLVLDISRDGKTIHRRCGINYRAQNVLGFFIVLTGMLLVISVLRQ
jgi:hypothetical protein